MMPGTEAHLSTCHVKRLKKKIASNNIVMHIIDIYWSQLKNDVVIVFKFVCVLCRCTLLWYANVIVGITAKEDLNEMMSRLIPIVPILLLLKRNLKYET